MSVSAIGSQAAMAVQQLVTMRSQFDDLQRQLSTGEKSATYAGLGSDSGVTVGLNAQLAALSSYDSTISMVSTKIDLMSNALSSMSDVGSNVLSALQQAGTTSDGSGQTVAQQTAQSSLGQLVDLLNSQSGNDYLFSGNATDQPSVVSADTMLNGSGSQAGLIQLISERKQADLGADGLGRLVISQPSSTSVSVAEDSSSPFGFKLASVSSNLTNGTVSGPSGSPASLSIDLSGVPQAGDTVTLRFNLPDGTTQNLTLTATTSSPPGSDQFTIGSDAASTAANLQSALTTSIGNLASTSLTAASAVAASNDFFNADANNPPQRVDGPPFDTATSMVAGTAANTVIWYTGEAGSSPALSTVTAQVDPSLTISYGARANEDGIRQLVQNVATLAAVPVSSSDPNANNLSAALNQRLSANLNAGSQSLTGVESQLASAQNSAKAAQTQHQQTSATLTNFLQNITGVSNEQVGSELLALQTRMQASMETTSMLFQTSLVNYLNFGN